MAQLALPAIWLRTQMSPLLNTPYFKDNLHLLVFDEVHCVASWGATFRTAYNEIDSMLSLVPHKSVMQ